MGVVEYILNGLWTDPGAILFSAFAAIIIAWYGVHHQRNIARQRETFEAISARQWDGDYLAKRQKFIELRDKPSEELAGWAAPNKQATEEATAIRSILNDYELIAIGIRHGILDEIFYRRWFRSAFISDFQKIEPYIKAVRRNSGNPRVLQEYEDLARRWTDEMRIDS
jgi:hypothetical protein